MAFRFWGDFSRSSLLVLVRRKNKSTDIPSTYGRLPTGPDQQGMIEARKGKNTLFSPPPLLIFLFLNFGDRLSAFSQWCSCGFACSLDCLAVLSLCDEALLYCTARTVKLFILRLRLARGSGWLTEQWRSLMNGWRSWRSKHQSEQSNIPSPIFITSPKFDKLTPIMFLGGGYMWTQYHSVLFSNISHTGRTREWQYSRSDRREFLFFPHSLQKPLPFPSIACMTFLTRRTHQGLCGSPPFLPSFLPL